MDIAVRPQLQLVSTLLSGRKGLVIGIANENSIAWGCARVLRELGAEIAVTWLNEKARPHVEPLAQALESPIALPLDVEQPGQMEAVFRVIGEKWGRLDFALHSIAYAPSQELRGRVIDTSRDGFARAMDISCHSFVRMARLAEPLMDRGGALLTVSFLGAAQVVPRYGVMGPVKSALESSVRYLATELGSRGIRPEGFRPAAEPGRATCTRRRAGRHHGRRLRLRLPRHRFRETDHRRHGLHRRWRERRRLGARRPTLLPGRSTSAGDVPPPAL